MANNKVLGVFEKFIISLLNIKSNFKYRPTHWETLQESPCGLKSQEPMSNEYTDLGMLSKICKKYYVASEKMLVNNKYKINYMLFYCFWFLNFQTSCSWGILKWTRFLFCISPAIFLYNTIAVFSMRTVHSGQMQIMKSQIPGNSQQP